MFTKEYVKEVKQTGVPISIAEKAITEEIEVVKSQIEKAASANN